MTDSAMPASTAGAPAKAASAEGRSWPATFEATYDPAPGFVGWLSSVNFQPMGRRYMGTALFFFMAGGVLALLMRLQLIVPENDLMGPQFYNELFTMHGSTMMFLFAVPFIEGLAMYLLPLKPERTAFVGTTALFFFMANTAKLPTYYFANQFEHAEWSFTIRFLPLVVADEEDREADEANGRFTPPKGTEARHRPWTPALRPRTHWLRTHSS